MVLEKVGINKKIINITSGKIKTYRSIFFNSNKRIKRKA